MIRISTECNPDYDYCLKCGNCRSKVVFRETLEEPEERIYICDIEEINIDRIEFIDKDLEGVCPSFTKRKSFL